MTRRAEVTEKMKAALTRSVSEGVDIDTLAVYEATVLTTLPLTKRNSIFDKGEVSAGTLAEMAGILAAGNSVPLHTLHQSGYELPVGRVFHGETFEEQGVTELRVWFYVPLNSAAGLEYAANLDSGTIDEFSVGLMSKHLFCSECGFDYLGPDADNENIWSRTCNNDHTIGEDGVFVRVVGVQHWSELSMVSRGASKGTRIQSRAKALLKDEGVAQRLTAAGITDPGPLMLFTEPSKTEASMADKDEGLKGLDITQLATQLAEGTIAKTELEALKVTLTAKEDALTASTTRVTELEAQLASLADASALQTKLTETETKLAKAVVHLSETARQTLVATGKTAPEIKTDLDELIAQIDEGRTALLGMYPVGGRSQTADSKNKDGLEAAASGAFKLRT